MLTKDVRRKFRDPIRGDKLFNCDTKRGILYNLCKKKKELRPLHAAACRRDKVLWAAYRS